MEDPTERSGFLFFWNGWPSQWHPSPFEIDGVRYSCCEQFMMAEKARLFDDTERLKEILRAKTPREHKALGREVEGFDDRRWTNACRQIVFRGNLAKYSQNAELRALLLATGEMTLAEASPSDKIWGIGLAASDKRATHPAQWPGKNWLGKALMQVRAELRKSP